VITLITKEHFTTKGAQKAKQFKEKEKEEKKRGNKNSKAKPIEIS